MSDGPPNFHQLLNASRDFTFERAAQYERSLRQLDERIAAAIVADVESLDEEWRQKSQVLAHFQARWVLKPVRVPVRFQNVIIAECYVQKRKFRLFITMDRYKETIWLLDIWRKSGSAKEQSQLIERAAALASEILKE